MKMKSKSWSKKITSKADANGIWICDVKDVPPWMFKHRGIKRGYRYCRDWYSAIISMGYMHNETINVWTHVLGSFGVAVYYLIRLPELMTTFREHSIDASLVCFIVMAGNIAPLLASAGCHNFYCIDKDIHKLCWWMDYLGIIGGMYVNGFGFLYFSFYCNRTFVAAWMAMLTILIAMCIMWCWKRFDDRLAADTLVPSDRFPEFSTSITTFVVFASYIPVALGWLTSTLHAEDQDYHWILVESTIVQVLLAIGIVVFAKGAIPERFFNGNMFDIVGHSHQLWHLVSAVVMFFLADAVIDHYILRVRDECLI